MSKIILKGFYGFGNLGDDILMLTTYKIIKEIFPHAEVLISSESKDPAYIQRFLPGIKIVNSSEDIKVDWVIHGGGGVFFDFKTHGKAYKFLNHVIKFLGYSTYRKAYSLYQSLKGQKSIKLKARAGLGIGVGTYTSSSNRFFSDILSLSTFDVLLVRDDASVLNAQQYSKSNNIHRASDLAFLVDHWMPATIPVPQKKESIGFILRDWVFNDHVSILTNVAKKLSFEGYDVKFFAFDEASDLKFIESVSASGSMYCWRPTETTLENYLGELMACKLIISSRAHGAIISACLGIPVCCVCIEPKLLQVAAMLKNSARLIIEPFDELDIIKEIRQALAELPSLKEATLNDVADNRQEMLRGVALFKSFVATHSGPNR